MSHHSSRKLTEADRPVGIFDSGLGGLSILQHIHQLLSRENILYVADSGHAPYGCKNEQFVEQRSRIITEHLLQQGVKVVVIACNTATASIIETFRAEYGIPFIGVEPGIKPAIELSRNGNIGVMATTGTLSSTRYEALSQRFGHSVNVYNQPCPGLADQVEAGKLDAPETLTLLKNYVEPLLARQIDTIVLGCTHYSFLAPMIRQIAGEDISIVDTSRAVAEQLARVLRSEGLESDSARQINAYYTTGSVAATREAIMRILGHEVMVSSLPSD